jgi:hypothetical protein
LAGPWTISRVPRDGKGGADFGAVLGAIGSWSRRMLLVRHPWVRHRPAAPGQRAAGRPVTGAVARPAKRPLSAWRAIPLLAVMTAAAVFLGWATVHVARTGIAITQAAVRVTGGPLVVPAPRTAGTLPLRFGKSIDPASAPIAAEVHQRFAAVGAQLIAAAERAGGAGTAGRKITAIMPSGLYGQPGHLDPMTNRPAWISYVGFDASGRLGQPGATVTSLMMGILGKWSKIGPWPVPAGHRGGAANCTVAWLARTSVAVCGWATDRTMGVIASPVRDTSVSELAMLLLKMRYDLQKA